MTEFFDEKEELIEEGSCIEVDEDLDLNIQEVPPIDARRRLEHLLEERRLREELDDFFD